MFLFLLVMLGAPVLFIQNRIRFGTVGRVLIALFPVFYTGTGYLTASLIAHRCAGGLKDIHGCIVWGTDVSGLVDYGMFLGIWFFFAGIPLSLCLLIGMAWDAIESRRKRAG